MGTIQLRVQLANNPLNARLEADVEIASPKAALLDANASIASLQAGMLIVNSANKVLSAQKFGHIAAHGATVSAIAALEAEVAAFWRPDAPLPRSVFLEAPAPSFEKVVRFYR